MEKIRTGVIGAGAISGIYLTNLKNTFDCFDLAGVAANHIESARKKADEFGIKAYTVEEMLADESIKLVIILTPVGSHYDLIRRALSAGKHVYTEKTITENTEQAADLIRLAEEKNLYLGSAPDTFLGTAFQTARKAIDDGKIGEINSFSIAITRNNDILTAYFPFLRQPGAGALRDYLVYYLTALVSLLGPVESVSAFVKAPYKTRMNNVPETKGYGEEIETPNESVIAASVQLKNGIVGTIMENNETIGADRADFAFYGTKGVLLLGNPNMFGQLPKILAPKGWALEEPSELEAEGFYSENSRGLGPAEMVHAIFENRKHRASEKIAYHVLEVIEAMEEAEKNRTVVRIESECEIPAFFNENYNQ